MTKRLHLSPLSYKGHVALAVTVLTVAVVFACGDDSGGGTTAPVSAGLPPHVVGLFPRRVLIRPRMARNTAR